MTALMLLGKKRTPINHQSKCGRLVLFNPTKEGQDLASRILAQERHGVIWCGLCWRIRPEQPINWHCLVMMVMVMTHAELPVGSSTAHWTCLCFASPGRLLSCCGCSPDGRQLPSTLRGPAQTWWFQSFCARAPSMIRYDHAWLKVWFSMGCANALSQSVNECTVTSLEGTVGA